MSALRRKKGNIAVAILMFLISIAYVVLVCFSPIYKEVTTLSLVDIAFKSSGTAFLNGLFKPNMDYFKTIKFDNLDIFWTFVLIAPFISSLLAVFFKRYRLINALNFATMLVSAVALLFCTPQILLDVTIVSNFNAFSITFAISGLLLAANTLLALVNLELCR